MRKLTVALAAMFIWTANAHGQGKTDPTLDKLAQEFAVAFNAKDAQKVASFYAEDAVLMPPNQAMVKGRSGIENHFKAMFQAGVTNLQLRPMESMVTGEQAFDAGSTNATIPGGGTVNGKYVVVFKRVGGSWKIVYDIFNDDVPPPPAQKK